MINKNLKIEITKDKLDQMYRDCYDDVAAHLLANHYDPDLVFDAIQDICLVFILKLRTDSWQGKKIDDLSAYFKVACRWHFWKLLNKKKKIILEPDNGFADLPIYDQICLEEEIRHVKRELIVKRNLERISAECKEVLILYYFEELTNLNIANIADITVNNVRVRKHRCLERYKLLLEKNENIDDYILNQ